MKKRTLFLLLLLGRGLSQIPGSGGCDGCIRCISPDDPVFQEAADNCGRFGIGCAEYRDRRDNYAPWDLKCQRTGEILSGEGTIE